MQGKQPDACTLAKQAYDDHNRTRTRTRSRTRTQAQTRTLTQTLTRTTPIIPPGVRRGHRHQQEEHEPTYVSGNYTETYVHVY